MADTGLLVDATLTVALVVQAVGLGQVARRRPDDRASLQLVGLAVVAEILAALARVAVPVTGWPAAQWVGDALSVVAPVLLLAGLVSALRHRVKGLRLNVLLDGLGGALAGAAVASLVVMPLALQVWDGTWTAVMLIGRPLLDTVLVAACVGALGLLGLTRVRQLGIWTVGVLALTAADTARSMDAVESAPAAVWVGGMLLSGYLLVALAASCPGPDHHQPQVPGPRSLTVPSLASFAAVAVLTVSPDWDVEPLSTAVALAALAVCAVRFVRVFLQLHELAEIREQALTDELTGLANRRALYLHLDALLDPEAADAAEAAGADLSAGSGEFAVALVDLDHFKEVNDTHGHAVGDAMLKGVTERFDAVLRELETPYLFARLGGDEFLIVLHEAVSRNAALIVGQALVESLTEPLELGDVVLHAQASIGVAAAPTHGTTRSELLFAADAAMYAAKTSGERVRFHAPGRDEKSAQLTLAEELYAALDRHELVVEYQPICTVVGETVAAEAYVRWQHPHRGLMLPAEFLDAADRYRLTGAVAQRVLGVALPDLARWRAYGVPMTVSVNLSAADLRDESVVATVAEALLEHRVPAEALTVDVNERDLAGGDLLRATEVLNGLHDLGVRLALDDYGSGGLALAALADLPFDEVKLDRRFVRDVAVSERGTGVVAASLGLVHALGMRMVAEGVEDRRALARLAELGCDLVQGWHVGRPGSSADLEARLSRPTGGKHRLRPHEAAIVPDQPIHGDEHRGGSRLGRRLADDVTTTGQ